MLEWLEQLGWLGLLGLLGLLKLLGNAYVTTQGVLRVVGSPPRRPSLLHKGLYKTLYKGKRAVVAVVAVVTVVAVTAATMAS